MWLVQIHTNAGIIVLHDVLHFLNKPPNLIQVERLFDTPVFEINKGDKVVILLDKIS